MKRISKLTGIIAATALLGACSLMHKMDTPSSPYQQCNGLKQKMMFINTNMNGAYSQFQIQQQQQHLQKQFDGMNCQTILANKGRMPAKN